MPKSPQLPGVHGPVHVSPHGYGSGSAPAAPPATGAGKIAAGTPHMPIGGKSSHGSDVQAKYAPGSGPKKPMNDANPHVSKPYDSDGDDWL